MKDKIIEELRDDTSYYGEFGQKWLSSSDIGALLSEDPLRFKASSGPKLVFVQGGYFHTAILEPHKLDANYEIVDVENRHSKIYKDKCAETGKIHLLPKDVVKLERLIEATLNDIEAYTYIRGTDVLYEEPGYTTLEGLPFKGKADIVHNDLGLVVDLKTTADIDTFEEKITLWNYDSQAYIYEKLFGKPFTWVVCCKRSNQIKVVHNSEEYRISGADKVQRAAAIYKEWFAPN